MGFFTGLLTLPLAPVRGAVWVVEQVAEEAERQLHDDSPARRELLELQLEHESGAIDEQEYHRRADELLDEIARARQLRAGQVSHA